LPSLAGAGFEPLAVTGGFVGLLVLLVAFGGPDARFGFATVFFDFVPILVPDSPWNPRRPVCQDSSRTTAHL